MNKTIGKTAIILLPPWSPLIVPLGITTVAEIFRQNGIECKAFDWNIELLHEFEKKYSESFNRDHELFWDSVYVSPFWKNNDLSQTKSGKEIISWVIQKLKDLIANNYTTFGFSVFESNYLFTSQIIGILRKIFPKAMILLGGPATHNIIEYQYNHKWLAKVDYIFYREIEATLPEFIRNFKEHLNDKRFPGTAFLQRRKFFTVANLKRITKKIIGENTGDNYYLIYTPYRQKTNLSLIPDINFDNLNLSLYKSGGIPIEFSRGCVGACAFCSETIRYRPYRNRTIDDLIRNIKIAMDKYQAKYINFICSALNGDKKHLTEFCKTLISQKIKIKWGGNARPDRTLDAEMLLLMSSAGCYNLDFGLESGSDRVLHLMNKNTDVATASEIVKNCHSFGIQVAVNLIVGFPGETEKDLQDTISFIEKTFAMVEIFNVSKCYVDGQAPLGMYPVKFELRVKGNKVLAVDPKHEKIDTMPDIVANGPHWSDWCTNNGDNTPYIRNQRYQKVLETIDKLGKRGNTPHDAKKSNDLTRQI